MIVKSFLQQFLFKILIDNDLKEKLQFHESINRNQILWYSFQEYLIRNEINSVVFLTMPEGLNELILYQAAKAQNVDVLILCQSPVSDQFFSFRSIQDCGNYDKKAATKSDVWYPDKGNSSQRTHQHSRVNSQGYDYRDILKICRFLLKVRSLKLLNPAYILRHAKHLHDAPADIDLWKDQFAKFFYCKSVAYFEFLTSDHSSQFDLNQKFVYFPLQSSTELHSEISINRFGDQLLALERLASILPRRLQNCCKKRPIFETRITLPQCFFIESSAFRMLFDCQVVSKLNS